MSHTDLKPYMKQDLAKRGSKTAFDELGRRLRWPTVEELKKKELVEVALLLGFDPEDVRKLDKWDLAEDVYRAEWPEGVEWG